MDAAVVQLLAVAVAVLLLLGLRRPRAAAASARPRNHCPYPNPVLGNLVPLLRNFHRFLDWATDLLAAAPSGTIEVRGALGLGNGVATADPAVVDHFLRANFPNYVKGARFAAPFADLLGSGIFLADGRLWSLQRKLASHSFTSRALRRVSGRVLRAHLHRRLLPLLADAADAGETVDLQDVLKRFGFDNICDVVFGVGSSTLLEAAGEGDPRRHEAFSRAFDDAVQISFARMFHPTTVVWKAMRLAGVGSERRLREAIGVVDYYVTAMMESGERLRGDKKGDDEQHQHLLARFTAAMEEEEEEDDGSELGAMFRTPEAKRRFLRDVVVSFILAGKDSTSAALTWLFWLLAANPRSERRVHEEVSRHGHGHGLDGDGYDELKGMHYLHAAITEAMRLYPPVPINTRVAAAGDVLPDGTVVRAGWFSDYCAYAMGRMARLWGEDCREFRPERWLDGRGEFVAVDAARYPVFHAGPRACLGKEMAYMQMKAVVAAVVRRFAIEPVLAASMEAPPPYEMTATLKMKGGLPVRIRRRDGDAGRHKLDS